MSETTTPTPKRGRPAKAKEATEYMTPVAPIQTPEPTPKPARHRVRREEKVSQTREYSLSKKSGATFLMQQKNVMTMIDGGMREIRYCPNEPSIYRDEQNKASIRKAIIFTDGRIFVNADQPNLSTYLDAHPDNKQNGGNRFFLVDERKNSVEKLDKEFLEHDAIGLIRNKDLDELLSVALGLGFSVDRPVAEIKHDLMVFAKRSPKKFIEAFDNPIIEMKSMVKQAINYQVIRVDKKGAYWHDTNKLIVSVPEGKDSTDVLVRYCMTESAVPLVAEIERQIG